MPKNWRNNFTKREREEIDFCITYKVRFGHGTPGHLFRIIIAKMAGILDGIDMENYAEDAKAKKHRDELYKIEYYNECKEYMLGAESSQEPTPTIHELEEIEEFKPEMIIVYGRLKAESEEVEDESKEPEVENPFDGIFDEMFKVD